MGDTVTEGVLFDFSGTLFLLEPTDDWFAGLDVDPALVTEVLTSPATADYLPAELAGDWHRRDLDVRTHRVVYLAAMRAALPGLPAGALETIYERVSDPRSWAPYPDTLTALRGLRAAGIPVAVVSNIPWDIDDVFRHNGMADLVDEFVLSFREGVMKPDPKIFLAACRRIGVEPGATLMIGDSEHADGGATGVGCRFAAVRRVPPATRPRALISALSTHRVLAET